MRARARDHVDDDDAGPKRGARPPRGHSRHVNNDRLLSNSQVREGPARDFRCRANDGATRFAVDTIPAVTLSLGRQSVTS